MNSIAYDECSREPIHRLGAIQPHGVLVICKPGGWAVSGISANADEVFGTSPEAIIGTDLRKLFSHTGFHAIANLASSLARERECQKKLDLSLFEDGRRYDVCGHRIDGSIYLEIEPRDRDFVPQDNFTFIHSFVSTLMSARTDEEYYASIVKQVRLVTTYDRVMLYRFSDDGSGEVIAESVRAGLPSYLGLRYPATDIPEQARRLFIENRVRPIGDVDAAIIPMLPLRETLEDNPDLGMTSLRSVSGIHLQYLRNMGVQGSLSLSIVIDGKLWGLIACHHESAKWLEMERRSTLEMLSLVVSLQIDARLRSNIAAGYQRKHGILQSTVSSIDPDASLQDELRKRIPALTELIACDGIGLWIDSTWHSEGVRLDSQQLSALISRLDRIDGSDVFSTRCIADMCPAFSEGDDVPAGMLVLPISRSPQDYILFFRKESAAHVRWAGKPDEPKERDPETGKLTPRASFEEWKQIERLRSDQWSDIDLGVARQFRVAILEFVLRYAAMNQMHRDAAIERQRLLVAELNHRVKNILALFQSLVGHERQQQGETLKRYVGNLRGRIMALALAHDNIIGTGSGQRSLDALVHSEIQPYLTGYRRCEISGPSVTLVANAYSIMALVIHEMTTNSVKYGALGVDGGRLDIDLRPTASGGLEIEWAEHGGPVPSVTTSEGLGTTIIKRLVPYELGGVAEVKLETAGLRARFELPPHCVTSVGDAAIAPPVPEAAPAEASADLENIETVLLLEDNMLVALDTESILLNLGIRKVEIASNTADAYRLLEQQTIDLAVLDINLGTGTSLTLADALKERGIPMLFLSGYGDIGSIAVRHADTPSVEKPAQPKAVRHAIRAAIAACNPVAD